MCIEDDRSKVKANQMRTHHKFLNISKRSVSGDRYVGQVGNKLSPKKGQMWPECLFFVEDGMEASKGRDQKFASWDVKRDLSMKSATVFGMVFSGFFAGSFAELVWNLIYTCIYILKDHCRTLSMSRKLGAHKDELVSDTPVN